MSIWQIETGLAIAIGRGEISILDIPPWLRLTNRIYYINALRWARERPAERQHILELLYRDINKMQGPRTRCFMDIYETFVVRTKTAVSN